VGQRHPAHDRRLPRRRARGAGLRRTRHALPADDRHRACRRSPLDDTDQAILTSLAGGKGLSTSEIAKAIALTPRATRTRLARLVGRGLVREIGTGPQDPQRRYHLADRGPA
jgi:DNA-binding transcriptional ArsR family regulator